MSTAVAKKENTELALAQDLGSWGESPVSVKDVVIPRMLVMNGTSELVTEGEAGFGEIRCSLTKKKLADLKNGVKIVPFAMKKCFIEYDADAEPKQYLRRVEMTPANENLPYNDKGLDNEGKECNISRDYVMEFFCLLPEEIDRGGELPYIITFRRTALRNGKKLATQMFISNRGAGLPPPGLTVELFTKKESNDDNTWAVPDVRLDPEATSKTKPEHVASALKWFKMINQVKVHEADEEATPVMEKSNASVETGPAKF